MTGHTSKITTTTNSSTMSTHTTANMPSMTSDRKGKTLVHGRTHSSKITARSGMHTKTVSSRT